MPKFFVSQDQVDNNKVVIIGKDVNHIKNVLRKKLGDEIIICNNSTLQNYVCEIVKLEEKKIICNIKENLQNDTEPNIEVSIFQGLPKKDKMELVIQKTVELGGYEITPVEMRYCVVKLTNEDKQKKIERWQKISEVASKQCGRNQIPKINPVINIKDIPQLMNKYDIVIVPYENEQTKTLKEELKKIAKINKKPLKIAFIIRSRRRFFRRRNRNVKKSWCSKCYIRKKNFKNRTVAINILSIIMYELET